jgi:shikimate dehydrogenase
MKDMKPNITGNTSVCAVMGDPIEHTLSPKIHNEIASALKQDMVYVPFHVREGNVQKAIEGAYALGIKGMNVTMPHKKSVMSYLIAIDEKAKQIGAVNTLVYSEKGYIGYNTDAIGLKTALDQKGFVYKGQDVAIIGSGGAAYATVVAVIEEAKSVHLFNRTKKNAQDLKNHLQPFYQTPIIVHEWSEEIKESSCQVVIQTTELGMGKYTGEMPPCAKPLLEYASYAVDLIYKPWETPFLAYAKDKGCVTMNGFDMLFYQAVRAYEYMHGPIQKEEILQSIKTMIESTL